MIKKINIEEIKKREEFLYGKLLTRKEVEYALEEAKASVKRNMEYLNGKFPFSAAYNSEPFPSERDGMYPITENVEWTTGFWTGLIWLMYDWSREECFKELGMADVRSFKERVEKRIDLNHHDLGFLYSPSCVAARGRKAGSASGSGYSDGALPGKRTFHSGMGKCRRSEGLPSDH